MKKHLIATAAALLLAAAAPAQAISFEGAITQGGTTVANYASTGLVSFDIDFRSFDAAAVAESREPELAVTDAGARPSRPQSS